MKPRARRGYTSLEHYQRLLKAMADNEVRYVIVGVDGFNQWAPGGQGAIETQDIDLVIASETKNFLRLLNAIEDARDPATGDRFIVIATNGEDAKEINTDTVGARNKWARWIAKSDWSLVAEMPNTRYHAEMIRSVTGFTFEELECDSVVFDRRTVPMRVAQLGKILESKRIANRPKDKAFFARYKHLIDDAIKSAKARARGLTPNKTPRQIGR